MNKKELIDRAHLLSERPDMSKADIAEAMDCFIVAIEEALKSGDKVELKGFATFFTKDRPARKGRNPKTGAGVDVPAKTVALCKVSKKMLQD